MKKMNRVLAVAAFAAVLGVGSSISAQALAVGEDGLVASPKVRAQINERRANSAIPAPKVVVAVSNESAKPWAVVSVAASPKLAQLLAEREASKTASTADIGSTTVAVNDGIAASPKLREQLNERRQQVEIAPVK